MRLSAAYAHCAGVAQSDNHYLAVLARVLPGGIRRAVYVLWAFEATTRSVAEPGAGDAARRRAAIDALQERVRSIEANPMTGEPVWVALADTIRRHRLPLEPLCDLLHARHIEIDQTCFTDFGELMSYCRYAANPLGRLFLYLQHVTEPRHTGYADSLASALQLLALLLNLPEDYRRYGRIYLPQEEMARFHVSEEHLSAGRTDADLQRLMHFQVLRVRRLLKAGSPLGRVLRGRNGLAVRLAVLGADRIAVLKAQQRHNAFAHPRLTPLDWLALGAKAVYHGLR